MCVVLFCFVVLLFCQFADQYESIKYNGHSLGPDLAIGKRGQRGLLDADGGQRPKLCQVEDLINLADGPLAYSASTSSAHMGRAPSLLGFNALCTQR